MERKRKEWGEKKTREETGDEKRKKEEEMEGER